MWTWARVHTQYLNSDYNSDVPLLLMNSFNTDEDTERIIQKYSSHKVTLTTCGLWRSGALIKLPSWAGWFPQRRSTS